MARIPSDAGPETQRTLRQIWEALEELKSRNQDLHGRRIVNTGTPQLPFDYTNKLYVDTLVENAVSEALASVDTKISRMTAFQSGGGGSQGGGGIPPSGGRLDFGYYRVDVGGWSGGEETRDSDTVKGWTNITYCGPFSDWGGLRFPDPVRPEDILNYFQSSVARIYAAGLSIFLDVDIFRYEAMTGLDGLNWCRNLFSICGNSGRLKYITLGNEMDVPGETIDHYIRFKVKAAWQMQFPDSQAPPIGACLGINIAGNGALSSSEVDFIGFEGYTPNGEDGSPGSDVQSMITQMEADAGAVDPAKSLVLTMQAYNRNGCWQDISSLAALNRATYFDVVRMSTRYDALIMFNWAKYAPVGDCPYPSKGTKHIPELQTVHQQIWAAIAGGSSGGGGTGPKKCSNPWQPEGCDSTPGTPVPCCGDGGLAPCNCPRMCTPEGGHYAAQVEDAINITVNQHPELFQPDMTHLLDVPSAEAFRGFVKDNVNDNYPTLHAINDPGEGKQILVRLRTNPQFNVHYRVWNSSLTVARPSGSGYECTCWPFDFGWEP